MEDKIYQTLVLEKVINLATQIRDMTPDGQEATDYAYALGRAEGRAHIIIIELEMLLKHLECK
jgi:hypothetical protein